MNPCLIHPMWIPNLDAARRLLVDDPEADLDGKALARIVQSRLRVDTCDELPAHFLRLGCLALAFHDGQQGEVIVMSARHIATEAVVLRTLFQHLPPNGTVYCHDPARRFQHKAAWWRLTLPVALRETQPLPTGFPVTARDLEAHSQLLEWPRPLVLDPLACWEFPPREAWFTLETAIQQQAATLLGLLGRWLAAEGRIDWAQADALKPVFPPAPP